MTYKNDFRKDCLLPLLSATFDRLVVNLYCYFNERSMIENGSKEKERNPFNKTDFNLIIENGIEIRLQPSIHTYIYLKRREEKKRNHNN